MRSRPRGEFVARWSLGSAFCVAACLAGVTPGFAAPRCEQPCKVETAACIRSSCRGLAAADRRACVERCRGIGGCAPIRTLAYVWNVCRSNARGVTLRRELRIRRGNCAPVTVMALETPKPAPDPLRLCELYGSARGGAATVSTGGFQRLAVTPDGSGVIFEVTNDVAIFPDLAPTVSETGFFHVRADGTGLRRLGPPSRFPMFFLQPSSLGPLGFAVGPLNINIALSRDGRTVVYADRGPGASGEEANQIVTLDVVTGTRRQLTNLEPSDLFAEGARFVDDRTVVFVGASRPYAEPVTFWSVRTDGSGLAPLPSVVASGSGAVVPDFSVAGGPTDLLTISLPSVSSDAPPRRAKELFVWNGKNLLQLTSFGRWGTSADFLGSRRRVLFTTTADPLGTNPDHNGQLFSIDTLGRRLRQLTSGRRWSRPLPCIANIGDALLSCDNFPALQDSATDAVVFASSCDQLDTGAFGAQLYAVRPDGSRLRQLTAAAGCRTDADGTVTVEMPGPFGYSAPSR